MQQIREIIDRSICSPPEVYEKFLARFDDGKLTRDEEKASHFCVYFLPYNPESKKIFMVHHKKSGLWLSPGGHIDKGETPLKTLAREMNEELGVTYKAPANFKPFLLTITPIENAIQPCRAHYDLWYGVQKDGSDFQIDPREFNETRWLTVAEARELVTDPPNLKALEKIEQNFF